MVIDWSLQEATWDELETLRNADRVPLGTNDVQTRLVENFHGEATARDFSFVSDEPGTMAEGQNRGPGPSSTSSQALRSVNRSYAKNALATGIELTDLQIEVGGDIDPRGVLGVGDQSPGFVDDEINYTTYIESPASRDEVGELVDLAERHCPAHASLRNSVEFDRTIVVNGEPLFD